MTEILLLAASSYALTFLLTVSFAGGRLWREPITDVVEYIFGASSSAAQSVSYFLECRMCSGFWVSLGVVAVAGEWWQFLPVYGLSYFMATQERD